MFVIWIQRNNLKLINHLILKYFLLFTVIILVWIPIVMSTTLYSLASSTICNMFFGSNSISITFLGRIFFIVTTIFCLSFGCHSKVSQKPKKENIIDCDFNNVSNSYRLSHSWENDSTNQSSQKRIRYFNASKSNIATLPCYDYNTRLLKKLKS